MLKKGVLFFTLPFVVLIALVSVSTCQFPGSAPDYPCEGTFLSPVLLAVGNPHRGTIEGGQTSYYAFVAASGPSHTVSLTQTQSDLAWKIYDDSGNYVGGCDDWYGPADEIAVTPGLIAGDLYYLLVMEYDLVDGTFTLTVTSP